ncbi:MAG: DUF4089 domain-containing protein [Pseudomonadota bacterium]
MSSVKLDDAYLDATSAALELHIPERHRDGVKRFLAIAAEMADILDKAPLDARDLALAPTFTLPEPKPDR